MTLKRVVITGLGALTPVGNNVCDMWQAICDGVSGADLIKHFDASNYKTKIACELKGFNPEDHFDRKEARRMDAYTQYGIVAAREAVKDSGLLLSKFNNLRVGVVWGSGMGGVLTFQEECVAFGKGNEVPRFSPFFVPKTISDICPGFISIEYGFHGPNYSTVAACASSAVAISDAFNAIRLGKADVMLAGGSEAAVVGCGIGGFGSMQALSTRNDDPKTASRPFDKDRDGFVLGEGAGVMLLEDLDHAKARGAKIYAEITGCGLSADAFHITASHPDGIGACLAMREAVSESGMELNDVHHINTHGTSTTLGDISEMKAVASLFGDHAYKIALNSTKSMIGHLLGAAGAVESIITVLSIADGIVPPTINHFTDDPELLPLDYTFNNARKRNVDFALCNAFGFGGHNVSLAFRKFNG